MGGGQGARSDLRYTGSEAFLGGVVAAEVISAGRSLVGGSAPSCGEVLC